jgi:TPR repeat protein
MVLATVTIVVVILVAFSETLHHDESAILGLASPAPESELKALEAAAKAGNPDAQSRLAHEISLYQGPGIRAFQLIQRAANQQHPLSEYEMGMMLSGELLVWERNSSEIAMREVSVPDAVTWIKGLGGEGIMLAIDHSKAVPWFEKAADHGVYLAWSKLAAIYKEGRGVVPNLTQSTKWVRKLADAGDPLYMLEYARRLEKGDGIEPDPIQAFAWSLLVIESTYPAKSAIGSNARAIRERLASKLTTEGVSAARAQAEELSKFTNVCVGGLENC